MKIKNRFLEIELNSETLKVTRLDSETSIELNWPACVLSYENKIIKPSFSEKYPKWDRQSISQKFISGELEFEITITLSDFCWFHKDVKVTKHKPLKTIDYIDVDFQKVDDSLKSCGYSPTLNEESQKNRDEEGSGFIAGCGYPLIGRKYFIGLEHPAASNISSNGSNYYLRHYPQWNGDVLESISAVFSWNDDPVMIFRKYLDTIRLPQLAQPLVAFGTFWSDPYIGDYEYAVHYENYMSFLTAFEQLGLKPDVFTLDAGWNNRQSVFQAKDDMGGDFGLRKLREYMKSQDIDLSLWLSHNGPMGISADYLKSRDIFVGEGSGAAYSIGKYGVLMDKKLEKILKERFCELAGNLGALHFKMDWDNECASTPEFNRDFPSINHVRQGSINAMARIAEAMRVVNSQVIIRNGWWPSPWWLAITNHVWLCHSGDCEYTSQTSKNQREAASTHRDTLYYAVLQRDRSMIPLDSFDNHEFPDALRNPFVEEPLSWINAVWLSFMRGSSYLAYTLQPEKLENWQIESFKAIINFCREYSKNIFVKHGYMFGGCPSRGEVYGFMQPGKSQSWCILRNPSPLPQSFKFDVDKLKLSHNVKSTLQFYPYYKLVDQEIVLSAHGIALLIFDSAEQQMPFEYEFMTTLESGKYRNYFPSALTVNDNIRPFVNEIYQVPKLEVSDIERNTKNKKVTFTFEIKCPYRMRDFELQIGIKGPDATRASAKVILSRYEQAETSCCTLPVSEYNVNMPGYGEKNNPELIADEAQKYFAIRLADGGCSFYKVEINNIEFKQNELEMWLSGYEAPSRQSLNTNEAPFGFSRALPHQHPRGFPRHIRISE